METDYNVKINIPPPSVMKDDIHISGEKEGVAKVVEIINKDHAEYVRNSKIFNKLSLAHYSVYISKSGFFEL